MIRMVKGIYTYRKDHTSESTLFTPWSRTGIPFPSLKRKIQAYQEQNSQASVWKEGHAMSYHPPQTQPKQSVLQERPEQGGPTIETDITQLKQSILTC